MVAPTAEVGLHDRQTIDALAEGIRAQALTLDPDDALTLAEAEMAITDADDYTRGFEVLGALNDVHARTTTHYDRFRKPLTELTAVVRELEAPQVKAITALKQALGQRLMAWKAGFEAEQTRERQRRQAAADAAAATATAAAVTELETMAAMTTDPELATALRAEASATRETPMVAAPVQMAAIPKAAGHTREQWKARIDSIDTLIRAHVDGKCHLPLETLVTALGPWLDIQAKQHHQHLARVYPGTTGYKDDLPVSPRRRR